MNHPFFQEEHSMMAQRYFPGSNTCRGFVGFFQDLLPRTEQARILLIKGGPGCGKSTLLRNMKPVLAPVGIKSGKILFNGSEISTLSQREQSEKIGYVMQSPDNQIVTDKVWHELAFGLESLGFDNKTIRKRVAERQPVCVIVFPRFFPYIL